MPEHQKGQHIILSYEWKEQKLVLSVYDYLIEKGIPTWMDIKSGVPSANLYEGISEAIETSICFVCFMTPEYQKSDFCKQELQYAKQRNIPIIPLKLVENWEPSSWLGFITAGLVWLDFYHRQNFANNLAQLYSRISATVGAEFLSQSLRASKSIEKGPKLTLHPFPTPYANPLNEQIVQTKYPPLPVNPYLNLNGQRLFSTPIQPIFNYEVQMPMPMPMPIFNHNEIKNDSKFQ